MNRLVVESYGKEENAFGEISAFLHRRINEIPLGLCPVDYTLNVLNLAHAQSCGKCTPCRIGIGQISKKIETILNGNGTVEMVDSIESTARAVIDTADCAIGYETAKTVSYTHLTLPTSDLV